MDTALNRPRAAVAVLLAAGSAQAADAITFVRLMLDHGPAAEGNAWVAAAVGEGHLLPLLAAKAGVVGLVVLAVALLDARYPVAGALVATVAVAGGLVGAWSNVLVLLEPYAH